MTQLTNELAEAKIGVNGTQTGKTSKHVPIPAHFPGYDTDRRPMRRLSLARQPLRVGDEVRVVNTAKPIVWHSVRGFREDEVVLDADALEGIRIGAMLEDRYGCAVAIVLERDRSAGNHSDVYAQNLSCAELTEFLRNISSSSEVRAVEDTHEGCAPESYHACSSESDDDSDTDCSDGMVIEEGEEAQLGDNVMTPRVFHAYTWSSASTLTDFERFRVYMCADH